MDGDPTATGPTAVTRRSPAPDLARGLMLALIALANVHLFLYGSGVGARGYPVPAGAADRVVTVVQLVLVDGRAYPLFAALLGYGLVRQAGRVPLTVMRRRGAALLVLGLVHGVLLFPGDILGPYGLITLMLAGAVTTVATRGLLAVAAIVTVFCALLGAAAGFPSGTPFQPSAAEPDVVAALGMRLAEWPTVAIPSTILVLPAALVGVWAGRAGVLDDPAAHRRLLACWALLGLPVGALLGLPLALTAAGLWTPSPSLAPWSGIAHTAGGYLAALGWLGLLGLAAVVGPTGSSGWSGSAPPRVRPWLAAAGTWSMTAYVAQSVVFAALLAAWAGGLGDLLTVSTSALLALGTWAVLTIVTGALARRGHRGPLERAVRRVAYGSGRPR